MSPVLLELPSSPPCPPWQASCLLSYQLPPSGIWMWWCGGLTVQDSLLALAWAGLNCLWLYESLVRALAVPSLGGWVGAGRARAVRRVVR